ncbi:hypothetical protein Tco_0721745, partial [Tanacetum coccineum]
ITTAGISVSTAEPITTSIVNITTAEPTTPPTTTTTVFKDKDLTIAQTLVKMTSEKSKDNVQAMMDADYKLAARLQIDSFVPMDSEVVKGSKDRVEGSETRAEGRSRRRSLREQVDDLQKSLQGAKMVADQRERRTLNNSFADVF